MSTLEVNSIAPLSSSSDVTLGGSSKNIKFASGTTVDFSTNSPTILGITQGITEADQWRLSANTSTGGGDFDITSNLERVDTDGFNYIGTGMSESSGIFTFPTTGIYLLMLQATTIIGSADAMSVNIFTTTDNSTYNDATTIRVASSVSQTIGDTGFASFIFDVTNTSTHKCKIRVISAGTGSQILGNTDQTYTCLTFLRLGDT